ncbi:restriction endonuclease subunit S [Lacticaseibacillus zeae]|uniref:restriction endonuclease subunit S n=1 Tax=Lacticaseibacillus zeae TaxID=57037 RepID=UPI00201873AD|nr:restriction endonuclease subunit S [Lacticaseibacillus zeae]
MKVTSVKRVHQSDWRKEGVPFLRARDIIAFNKGQKIKEPIYISESQYEKYVKQSGRVTPGDLLVTGVGSIGVPFVVKAKTPLYFKDGNIIWFQNKTLDPDFLFYQFTSASVQSFVMSSSGKGTVGTFTISSGKRTPIVFPVMSEQRRIGMTLRNISNLIAATQQKIDNLERTKKALRRRIFDQSLRLKGYSDLWENHRLGELANIQGGGTPSTSKSEYWNGSIDWYAPAEIGTRRYVSGSKRRITELGLQKSSAVLLPANKTILFTSRAGIGNAAILTKTAATNQGFQSIVVKQNADIYFLFSKIPEIKHKAIRLAAGSTFLEISGKSLSKIQIKVPNHDEQSKIGKVFLQMDNLIDLTQSKLAGLKLLKQAMLENLFV